MSSSRASPALVFWRVVQQGGDDRFLRPAVLAHDRRYRQQVRDVRYLRSLARLVPVRPRRVDQGLIETLAVWHASQAFPFASKAGSRIQPSFGSHSGETP